MSLLNQCNGKTNFHFKRAGEKYPLYTLAKCLHAEQQILLGQGEQCNVPQRMEGRTRRREADPEILGPEEPGSGRRI